MKVKLLISANKSRYMKVLFLTGILISFLGWTWEMLYAAFILQRPNDRGFLTLPFCPIYGFSLIAIYLLFRTPQEMHLGKKEILKDHKVLRFISYFFLSGLLATAVEMLTGLFFDKVFHIHLWNYSMIPWNFFGYVAVLPSLFWGFSITVFMYFVFHPLFHMIANLKNTAIQPLFIIFTVILTIDIVFNFSYLIINGSNFRLHF